MPDYTVIRHGLDLLVRLIDTTMGTAVSGRELSFLYNGKQVFPLVKDDGSYAFTGIGRDDFELSVSAFGYEEKKLTVSFETLEARLPALELHMIPNRYYAASKPCFTMEGRLPGLASIDAVKIGDNPCFIREFDERKRIIKIFNPHLLEMKHVHYAVVNPDEETYEAFELKDRISDQSYKTNKKLEKEFSSNYPICRVVFGAVRADGQYLLRVRDSSGDARWIIRFIADGKEKFQTVDFNLPQTLKLSLGD